MSHKAAKRVRRTRSEADSAYVRAVLGAFMENMQALFKERAVAEYEAFPGMRRPCRTCAFNPSTNGWQGADSTAWGLFQALMNDRPFYCHNEQAGGVLYTPLRAEAGDDVYDEGDMVMCGGWAVVGFDKEAARKAFDEAVLKVGRPPAALAGMVGMACA